MKIFNVYTAFYIKDVKNTPIFVGYSFLVFRQSKNVQGEFFLISGYAVSTFLFYIRTKDISDRGV